MNISYRFSLSVILLLALVQARATDYYVSNSGSNSNNGKSISAPFLTITYALTKAIGAGDVVYVRGGTYREAATFSASGTAGNPITLKSYTGEQAIISGNDVPTLSWSQTSGKPYYQASYSGSLAEQLFVNGKPMVQARWPNLPTDANGDWNFWSPNMWATAGTGSSYGTVSDANLSSFNYSLNGALAVLNVNHQYYTWTRTVQSHTAGSNTFGYPQDLGASIDASISYTDDRYYLVGKLEFLDSPGEWFYDATAQILYFYPPAGVTLNSNTVEIKTRYYGLIAQNRDYLTVDGIKFFGTSFRFNIAGGVGGIGCDNIIFTNNTVENSSWTEYFSSTANPTVGSSNGNTSADYNYPMIFGNNCIVRGNVFNSGMLSALLISGYDNIIENNRIFNFNYVSSLVNPALIISRSYTYYTGRAGREIVRYNEIYNGGGVLLQVCQVDNNVSYNYLHDAFKSCYGGNKDVSALYCGDTTIAGTTIHHNWVSNGYAGASNPQPAFGGGIGIRGDDRTIDLSVHHNVTWNLGSAGVVVKSRDNPIVSEANQVLNNTSFRNSNYNATTTSVLLQAQANNQNIYSTVYNNVGRGIYAGWSAGSFTYVPASQRTNNYDNTALPVEDTANFDFRPKLSSTLQNAGKAVVGITDDVTDGSPDIGAYERGATTYWIPGFRDSKASFPILPNGAVNVSIKRDILMWQPAYDATAHKIYFGTDANNLSLVLTTSDGESNIYTLPKLIGSTTYYWKVNAIVNSIEVTGDTWSFTTATNSWKGTTSSSWNVASNWTNAIVPQNTESVIIGTNTPNAPILNVNYTVGSGKSLTINGTGSLTISASRTLTIAGSADFGGKSITVQASNSGIGAIVNTGTLSGASNVTIQQWITGQRGYRVLSNPFNTALTPSTVGTVNGITITGSSDVKTYNNSGNTWSGSVSSITANTPYAVFIRGLASEVSGLTYSAGPTAFAYGVTGTLNASPVSITPNATGFTLVGNPFAAPVNSSALTNGVGKSYYVYNAAQGSTGVRVKAGGWSSVLSSSATRPIPMMGVIAYQAGSATSYNVSATDINTTNSATTGLFGEATALQYLELQVSTGGNYHDKLYVRADATASEASNENMDLVKLNNDVTNIYTIAADKAHLAVNARKGLDATIPVGITAPVGSYTFTVASNNLPNASNVYLLDKLTNTKTALDSGATYSFEITSDAATQGDDRFELGAVKTAIQDVVTNDNFSARVLGNVVGNAVTLQVKGAKAAVQITVLDVQGKIVSTTTSSKEINTVSLASGSGMYLIKVTDGDNSIVNKVVKP